MKDELDILIEQILLQEGIFKSKEEKQKQKREKRIKRWAINCINTVNNSSNTVRNADRLIREIDNEFSENNPDINTVIFILDEGGGPLNIIATNEFYINFLDLYKKEDFCEFDENEINKMKSKLQLGIKNNMQVVKTIITKYKKELPNLASEINNYFERERSYNEDIIYSIFSIKK